MTSTQTNSTQPDSSTTSNSSIEKPVVPSHQKHRAPSTKDIESNNWVFGAHQKASAAFGARSTDQAATGARLDREGNVVSMDAFNGGEVGGDGDVGYGKGAAATTTTTTAAGMGSSADGEDSDGLKKDETKRKMNPLKKVIEAVKQI